MQRVHRWRFMLATAVAGGASFTPGHSLAQPVPPNSAIPPTVTVAMGDVGGKFFGRVPDPNKTRHYYIAAEPQAWDYAPLGEDPVCGKPLPPPIMQNRQSVKLRYVQYTDDTFRSRVIEKERLGLLGPVLRGVVGEYLAVTFLNRGSRPLSMHPHGVKYDKDSEGAYYLPKPGLGSAVEHGARFTYVWQLDEASGPLPGEPSSKGWLYHSHVEPDVETDLGLVGFIVVTDPERANDNGLPNDIDREMAALFMIHDESGIGAAQQEAIEYGLVDSNSVLFSWSEMQEKLELGARHAINGYVFGNTPGLEMNQGERVRWYLFGLGSENDFHTAHWHGMRVVEEGYRRTDVVELLPASMKVADMVAESPGSWLFHCHVADHMLEGMFASVVVHPQGSRGVSRDSNDAFFDMPRGGQTVQIREAVARINLENEGNPTLELNLRGNVTVFQAFSIFTQPISVQLGEKKAEFKPNARGVAQSGEDSLRVLNASRYGVVYGGSLAFEFTLRDAAWLDELQRLHPGALDGSSAEAPVPIELEVGRARHKTQALLQIQAQ